MSISHRELIEEAKEVLREKGFADEQIYEEFWFKKYRIDVVGWSPKRKAAVKCGYCSQKEKLDLGRFFDEVVCLPFKPQVKPVASEFSTTTINVLENTRLMLIKKDDVIFEVPLSREERSTEFLENEMVVIEQDFQQFSKLFDALSHMNRLKMMKLLLVDKHLTMRFAEFTRNLDLNPKLVWENTRKLSESGLIEKCDNGRYRCSEFGEASFIMLSFVLKYLREMFESVEGR